MKRRVLKWIGWAVTCAGTASAAPQDTVWQWSVPVGKSRAYLWIPENCGRVRAVLLAQHNLIERGILQHADMRRTLDRLGMAEVFVVPSLDPVFQFDQGAAEKYDGILRALAEVSGYQEIATAPVAPLGHSAHASFPWNFAAYHAERTLAALSIKGDAPLTNLTGSGRPNPDWAGRTLDGVPGLMVMSEQEWWEDRLAPLLNYRAAHPRAPLALLADAEHGHFDATDELIDFLTNFLHVVAEARLPQDGSDKLRPVDPAIGWLADRWRPDEPPRSTAAPATEYKGDRSEAIWWPDGETAKLAEAYQAKGGGKKRQQLGYQQNGNWVPVKTNAAGVELEFSPDSDGLSFSLEGGFIAPLPGAKPLATKDKRPPVEAVTPLAAAPGNHAAGVVEISSIAGPAEKIAPGKFRLAPDRMFDPGDAKSREIWFIARHPGDEVFKGAVQQARMLLPDFSKGAAQIITFLKIPDRKAGPGTVSLELKSDSGLPVVCHVREGPAFVQDGVVHLTKLPPRAKFPVTVTVVAWQPGCRSAPEIRAAAPVERTFLLTR